MRSIPKAILTGEKQKHTQIQFESDIKRQQHCTYVRNKGIYK